VDRALIVVFTPARNVTFVLRRFDLPAVDASGTLRRIEAVICSQLSAIALPMKQAGLARYVKVLAVSVNCLCVIFLVATNIQPKIRERFV
jgi:hypothetical protein